MAEDDSLLPAPRNDELRKARELVYTYATTEKLTLIMRKALNVMLQGAIEQGIEQDWYSLPITKLIKNIEFGSHDHQYLEETLERMQRTLIRWQSASPNSTEIVRDTVQLVGRTRIVGERNVHGKYLQKELRYKFDEDIKKRLLTPSVYALIDMGIMAKFKSPQSLALYEQVMEVKVNRQPAEDGWYYSDALPWREWRNLIVGGLTDDGDSSYSEAIKYFNRDVVSKALREIHKHAPNLEVEPIAGREGRRITTLQFRVRDRLPCQQPLPLDEDNGPPIDTDGVNHALEQMGLTARDIAQIVCRYDLPHIEATIALTKARAARTDLDPLSSKVAYFRKMLATPPASPAALATASESKASPSATAKAAPKPRSAAKKAEPSPMEPRFAAMAEDEQRRLANHWRHSEASKYAATEYDKQGLKPTLVRKAFFAWLEKHLTAP